MNKIANDIPNKIKQPSQCCKYCGKSYKKRQNLDKHIIICDLLQQSKKIKNDDEDIEIPSQKKLFIMVLELTNKVRKLEDKIQEYNKYIVKEKKIFQPLDWLNKNIIPGISFDNLISIFIIDENTIKYLFNNNFIETFNFILNSINIDQKNNSLPIYSFIQKNNNIYIFENKELGWVQLNKEKFIKFLNKISIKILIAFREWKKNNSEILINDEKTQILCDKTMSKLMSVDFNNNNIFSKIISLIYNKIKIDILPNFEYEF